MVRLWDAATGDSRGKPLEQGKPLKIVVIAPDGKSIASLDETGGAVLWDVPTGQPRFKRQEPRARSKSLLSALTRPSWLAAGGRARYYC